RLGWSSHDAIDAFERARGYPIERGAYVQALHRASKERRSKKRHKHSDELASSEESEMQRQSRKRSKHKRKHKSDTVSGDENGTPDIEAVWNQMAAVFEQHQSMMMAEQSASYGGEVSAELQRSQNSSHLSAEGSPFVGSTGTGEQVDDEEEGDHSGEQVY
uniref:RNA/RNP complex-1-interacting phosphatase n=1 Tax=Parascaris univalens TaxID=6257 RepID=A0A914ZR91_PARUN